MRRVGVLSAAIAVAGVLATGAGVASGSGAIHLTCGYRLVEVIPPGRTTISATATTGSDFGLVACSKIFGRGVQGDSFKLKPTTTTTGTASGRYKEWFDLGTIHGAFALSYVASATGVAYTGSAGITGGTGLYKGAKGSDKLTCVSPDGIHTTCTGKLTLTKV